MMGEYQDWQWRIDLGEGRRDILDLFLSLSGKEQIKLNGSVVETKFNFKLTKDYHIKLSDGSNLHLQIAVDWKNMGFPKIHVASEKGHAIERTVGPSYEPAKVDALFEKTRLAKNISLGFIWALPLITLGGAIPAGCAGGATVFALKFFADDKLTFSQKLQRVALVVAIEWIVAFGIIFAISK